MHGEWVDACRSASIGRKRGSPDTAKKRHGQGPHLDRFTPANYEEQSHADICLRCWRPSAISAVPPAGLHRQKPRGSGNLQHVAVSTGIGGRRPATCRMKDGVQQKTGDRSALEQAASSPNPARLPQAVHPVNFTVYFQLFQFRSPMQTAPSPLPSSTLPAAVGSIDATCCWW